MKEGIAAAAILVALGATAIGIVALTTDSGFDEQTLTLTTKREGEQPLDVGRGRAFTLSSPVTGDRTGKLVGSCLPSGPNSIACEVTYILEDGKITTQNGRLLNEPQIDGPIVGGTGAYKGASGTVELSNPDDRSAKLHLLLPE